MPCHCCDRGLFAFIAAQVGATTSASTAVKQEKIESKELKKAKANERKRRTSGARFPPLPLRLPLHRRVSIVSGLVAVLNQTYLSSHLCFFLKKGRGSI